MSETLFDLSPVGLEMSIEFEAPDDSRNCDICGMSELSKRASRLGSTPISTSFSLAASIDDLVENEDRRMLSSNLSAGTLDLFLTNLFRRAEARALSSSPSELSFVLSLDSFCLFDLR